MDRGIPPEERLLKLIRGKKVSEAKQTAAVSTKKAIKASPSLSQSAGNHFKDKIFNFINFKFMNFLLVLCLLIFLVYLVSQIFISSENRIKKISQAVEIEEEKQKSEIQISKLKDYEYYNKQFAKRDIFNAPVVQTTSATESSQKAISNFKLVGIILDREPQVILEDNTTKETHFLNKGERLDRIEVKDISESKVILIYAGEEIELEL